MFGIVPSQRTQGRSKRIVNVCGWSATPVMSRRCYDSSAPDSIRRASAMKKLFLTIAALAVLAGHPAGAADMRAPVYKALPPVYDPWTGGYVGINLGYSWGPWGASSNQPVFNFESLTASPKLNGWLGGFQAGHNWRVNGQWLLGIEGDIQITGEKAAQTWTDPELPPNLGETFAFVPRAGGPATFSQDWQLPWFATLRLR